MLNIRYIGSKRSMLTPLDKVFSRLNLGQNSVVGDLFAGTGAVSYFLSKKYNCRMVCNELLYCSYVITKAKLTRYTPSDVKRINARIEKYNRIAPRRGLVTRHFATSRMYFTVSNAKKIDAIRTRLMTDKMPRKDFLYILASLLAASNKVANITGVYGAFLKRFQRSALKPLTLEALKSGETVSKSAVVHNKDVMSVRGKYDVVYLDPPYNSRQYGDNYHVLEYIAKYKPVAVRGVTGLSDVPKSKWSQRAAVKHQMQELLRRMQRDSKRIVLSYNNEGLLSKRDILEMFDGPVRVHTIRYKRYKSRGQGPRFVKEFIFVNEPAPGARS